MKKKLLLLTCLVTLCHLAWTSVASAHPLGNFTVNNFSRVEAAGDRVYVVYVLDLAEIPTFQAGKIDAQVYARRIAAGAHLTVDGKPARLVVGPTALAHPVGAGGLRTTRLEVLLRGPAISGSSTIEYRDTNYPDRIGWKEIVVGKNAPSASDELRVYPKDLLESPLDVRSVTGDARAERRRASRVDTRRVAAGTGSRRGLGLRTAHRPRAARLLGHPRLARGGALLGSGARALAGSRQVDRHGVPRGAARHAVARGTARVDRHGDPYCRRVHAGARHARALAVRRSGPPVSVAEPGLRIARGLDRRLGVRRTLAPRARPLARAHHHHHHHHEHEDGPSMRSLFAVGISGGLLPCPSALVVLLAAISLHRVAFGLVLIVAFSLGLALTITGVGLVAVAAKRVFARARFDGAVLRSLPALSAAVILIAGVLMTVHALPKVT